PARALHAGPGLGARVGDERARGHDREAVDGALRARGAEGREERGGERQRRAEAGRRHGSTLLSGAPAGIRGFRTHGGDARLLHPNRTMLADGRRWSPSGGVASPATCHSTDVRLQMATLVAIAYPDEATAEDARRTVQTLEADLVIQADQVAAI